MARPREIELKLELDPSGLRRFRDKIVPGLSPSEGESRRLVSSYFDTRKRALAKRGLSLRVRQDGDTRIQTLKADGLSGAGLFDRPEWECPVQGDEPDLAVFGREARKLASTDDALEKLFETAVERTAWRIESDGAAIELALDEGRVSTRDASAPIAEVEMELKHGEPADLFRLARSLGQSAPLRLGVRSKSERGYSLASGAGRGAVKAEPVQLDAAMTTGEGFQCVARSCVRHFRLNEPALVEDRAPEALHQARVALRRLRSALSIFKAAVRDDTYDRLAAELRDVSRPLGDARDLDVLLGRLSSDDPSAAQLRESLNADRERAYDALLKLLDSKRFRLLMLDLVAWVEAGLYLTDDDLAKVRDAPVSGFAADVLERRRRKVKKAGRHLDRLEPEQRHRVRIEAKKLRYASEFFSGLVEGGKRRRRYKAFLGSLEELQSCLGDLNDMATASTLSPRLTIDPQGGFVANPAPETLNGTDEREAELLRCAVAARAALRDAKPFWTW